ncbi:MAG: hypothetical protein M3Q95_11045 [Bacteroidota bacterium]|nr:hypothetical protein [Bacteroidota bacterium]
MKIRIFLIMLAFCGSITGSAYAQGKIVMLNGKEKRFATAEVKGELIEYQPEDTTRNGTRKLDRYDVFSILRDDGTEEIIYNPDTVSGEDPTISEVRDYIIGERYAAITYRKPANFVTGLEVGFVSGFVLPVFYGVAVPIIYPAVIGQFTPKLETPLRYNYDIKTGGFVPLPEGTNVSNINVSKSFSAGYGKKARNMKIKSSLIGGGIGFALGATAIALILSR